VSGRLDPVLGAVRAVAGLVEATQEWRGSSRIDVRIALEEPLVVNLNAGRVLVFAELRARFTNRTGRAARVRSCKIQWRAGPRRRRRVLAEGDCLLCAPGEEPVDVGLPADARPVEVRMVGEAYGDVRDVPLSSEVVLVCEVVGPVRRIEKRLSGTGHGPSPAGKGFR
jgi:hypothetical protein